MKMEFKKIEGCHYLHDYDAIFRDIAADESNAIKMYRYLVKNDLFFILYFVMQIPTANHPFVVSACNEVQLGAPTLTLDLWAREHYKSTIMTVAEPVQKILINPNERIGIFSHTRPTAKGFLRSIKQLFEGNEFLKACFPDILYKNPAQESPKWSEDDGLVIKRTGVPKESTVEAWGLIEGMPTSKHFTHRVYDDIETADVVENPDTIRKLKDKFDLSANLGTLDGTERVIGTTYHHSGVLMYLKEKADVNGKIIYRSRIKPATVDGTPNGEPVLLPQAKIDILKANEYVFNCQQLLDPTPVGARKLDGSMLREIEHRMIPRNVFKFMVIDPAGDDKTGKGDAWAVMVVGVHPETDDLGASKLFIMDAAIQPFSTTEAIETIVRMYLRNGFIQKLGVEKAGLSTTELHIKSALAKHGRHISEESKTLTLLKPAGRNKHRRIEAALAWALSNGKIFISSNVSDAYKERLLTEMDKFPHWKDDGIDCLSYTYDLIEESGYALKGLARGSLERKKYKPRMSNNVTGY